MEKVHVCAENGSYDIVIGEGLLEPGFLQKYTGYAIVTDDIVYELYGKYFPDAPFIVLKAGEESKNVENLEMIYDKLMEIGIDRGGALAALGGGVVGDITGFAAATFKRGIAFVQYPTTLLAQVDSSVGGKVAVNLKGGKNMAGAFYQPKAVFADMRALETLPVRQFSSGMAEVIKYAYIADENLHRMLTQGEPNLAAIVKRCCEIKADYVKKDPYDTGVRMQLNYGHTIGHAIETAAGYGRYLHGEAIALGMVYAAMLGERTGISPDGLTQDTAALLQKYNLPITIDESLLDASLEILLADKKAEGNKINFVLIDKVGHAVLEKLDIDFIKNTVKEMSR